jgi:hypothetical protein
MKAVKTVNSNHNFGPPPGQEEIIGSLDCEIEEGVADFGGGRVIWSVWEPNDIERRAIANGQNIKLGVGWIGGFPPVVIRITDERKPDTFDRLDRADHEANH